MSCEYRAHAIFGPNDIDAISTLAKDGWQVQQVFQAMDRAYALLVRGLPVDIPASRVISDQEAAALQVTLETAREHVRSHLGKLVTQPWSGERMAHAAGYQRACQDVLRILDSHGRPAGEPVVLEAGS